MKRLDKRPHVSIVVVNHNGKRFLNDCFSSLRNLDYPRSKIEMIMVDNCSSDDSAAFMEQNFPNTIILKNRINNFCSANNLGIKRSKGDYVAILNNDTEVERRWLDELMDVILRDNRIAAVGSKVLLKDGRIQSTGHIEFPYHYWGDKGFLEKDIRQYDKIQPVPSVSNCSALYKKKALHETGFFDEDFNMYMEDVDICYRLRKKNWKVFYAPDSKVFHMLHGSGQDPKEHAFYIERNRLLFIAKHFPKEIKASLAGYGEISKLEPDLFNELLMALFNKIVKHHGVNKANAIFSTLNRDIRKIYNYGQHISCGEKEKAVGTKEEALATRIRQIYDLIEQINILNDSIETRDKRIESQQELLNDFNVRVRVHEERIRQLDEEIKARDNHLEAQNRVINSKDVCIQEKEKQLSEFKADLRIQEDRIKKLDEERKAGEAHLRSREKEIEERDRQIGVFKEKVNKQEMVIREQDAAVRERDTVIRRLDKDNTSQKEELAKKEQEISRQEGIVAEKNTEISLIYNSETYRWLVRPFIWPVFSFIKSLNRPLRFFSKKDIRRKVDQSRVSIAQLYSKTTTAEYLKKNEYVVKLINSGFSQERLRLLIDIWPYSDRRHPERHYAYFGTEFTVEARSTILFDLIYDWEKDVCFLVDNEKKQTIDFWRSKLRDFEPYEIRAVLYNLEGRVVDEIAIIQELKG